jgi:ubiquinone biosynthesis protein COQ4
MDLTDDTVDALQRGDVDSVTSIREVARVLQQPGLMQSVEHALLALPSFCAQYERVRCGDESSEASECESQHSLSAVLGEFRRHYALGPNFFPFSGSCARPLDYAAWLFARDHDAYHVLGEYETSDHDEVALQSFVCGQAPCVFAYFVSRVDSAAGLERACFKHLRDLLDAQIDQVAWDRGRRARPLLSLDVAEQSSSDVGALRKRFAIEPRSARPTRADLRNTCGGKDAQPFF